MQRENARKCTDILKHAGYNYAERLYDEHHSEHPEGISFGECNSLRCIDCTAGAADIPVRRIDLAARSRVFTPERREITVNVKVFPENSVYKDELELRITSVQGIASKLGEIVSAENGSIVVKCKGDDEFYLRALCKNGTDKYHVISSVRFSGEGLGAAFLDPYELIMGGLYTVRIGAVARALKRAHSALKM